MMKWQQAGIYLGGRYLCEISSNNRSFEEPEDGDDVSDLHKQTLFCVLTMPPVLAKQDQGCSLSVGEAKEDRRRKVRKG